MNLSTAVAAQNIDQEWLYSTNILKYIHPIGYHCYYTGKETYNAFRTYISLNSATDILSNLIYKTGKIFNNIRILMKVSAYPVLQDRDIYVLARSSGAIINIIFSPYQS